MVKGYRNSTFLNLWDVESRESMSTVQHYQGPQLVRLVPQGGLNPSLFLICINYLFILLLIEHDIVSF